MLKFTFIFIHGNGKQLMLYIKSVVNELNTNSLLRVDLCSLRFVDAKHIVMLVNVSF